MTDTRALLEELFAAAVAGAQPGPATAAALPAAAFDRARRPFVFAVGKAAHGMAAAAIGALRLQQRQVYGGLVVAAEAAEWPHRLVESMVGDHPLPGPRSVAAARRLGELARGRRAGDVALVFVSGGATALVAAPADGVAEHELEDFFQLLLGSGLDVREMNVVRKRFTMWGAGRLARALAPAETTCLCISDVPGDEPATIGSGPCSPDPTTAREVQALLERADLWGRVAPSIREHLLRVMRVVLPETPKPRHPCFAHVRVHVVASGAQAVDAAAAHARQLDAGAVTRVELPLGGDAIRCGERLVHEALDARRVGGRGLLLWRGETTMRLPPEAPPGGRNQALALSAARALHRAGDDGRCVTLLAAGTDGRDGTTDAAGAVVDGSTWSRIAAAGIDPDQALTTHTSHRALDAVQALIRTGATGTNVADIAIAALTARPAT